MKDRLSPLTFELPGNIPLKAHGQAAPQPLLPQPTILTHLPQADATSLLSVPCWQWKSSSPTNLTLALQDLTAAALLSFLFMKNKLFSPFLPAKQGRGDWTNTEDKLPTWLLASLLRPSRKLTFLQS